MNTAAPPPPGTPRLYLEPSTFDDPNIEPGDQIVTELKVANVTETDWPNGLFGWSMYLYFNPGVIKVNWATMFTFWLNETAEPPGTNVLSKRRIKNLEGWLFMGQTLDIDATKGANTNATHDSATLAIITFDVVGRGVSDLDLDTTELSTVIGTTPWPIDHEAEDGLFDNREANLPPVAKFEGPTLGIEGYEVTFDGSASYDQDNATGGRIVSYMWDFGDGTPPVLYVEGVNFTTTVQHTFATEGVYTVTLTVCDNDGEPGTGARDINILIWMESGTFPDLVGWEAKPESPRLDESPTARGLDLLAMVGNPTDDNYAVYAEFTLISKDEAKVLGTLTSETVALGPKDKQTLTVYFDTMDPTWRCFSGSPEWVGFGYYHWFFHKYMGFVSCYYKNSTMSAFEKANVAKYISFDVASFYTHDVAVLNVTASPTEVKKGGTFEEIDVTVANLGELDEYVLLTVSYIGGGGVTGFIDERWVYLAVGENKTETFSWTTPSTLDPGPYLIEGRLPALAFEKAVGDNYDIARVSITGKGKPN
jgi:PKD repeat protein